MAVDLKRCFLATIASAFPPGGEQCNGGPGRRYSEVSLSISRTQTFEWDGKALSGWVNLDGTPTKVSADRQTIHTHAPGFSDALDWEIDRHRDEIFEKLLPFFKQQK